jgi:KaiC/GvpD/RAD55 family RecA-like ATPase
MVPRIPLIEDLMMDSVPAGSAIMVEFDPTSQWYAASISMGARWLRTGGTVTYSVNGQTPDSVRAQFRRLGFDVEVLEKDERLVIFDGYTITLGRSSSEKYAAESLKAGDLSITYSREVMQAGSVPELLTIVDTVSSLARYNDDRAWVEFLLTRGIPSASLTKSTTIAGIIRGLHPDSVYKQLEAAVDGVIDMKLDDESDPPRNLIRIRSMRNLRFDGRWREITCGKDSDITLKQ